MESTRITFREGSDMKVKDLLNLIENNVLDENAKQARAKDDYQI